MKRFEIRLEKELHEKLRKESFETEKSMHEIVIELIEEHYNKNKKGGNKMLKELGLIEQAMRLVEGKSNTNRCSQEVYDIYNRIKDDAEEIGELNSYLMDQLKSEILASSKYAGYTNIQYQLMEDVKEILNSK